MSGGRVQDRQLKHPPIDVADQAVLFGDRQERPGGDHLAAGRDQPHEQLVVSGRAGGDLDDRLGVEHEPILVERVADPPDPAERFELATLAQLTRLAFGDVTKRDHAAGPVLQVHGCRGVGHRHRRAVLAPESILVGMDRLAGDADLRQGAVLDRVGRAVGVGVMKRRVRAAADQLGGRVIAQQLARRRD